jgi:4-hydroxy-3-methylbut-2-enyl diphosphate reductase
MVTMKKVLSKIIVAKYYGFCMGVKRAIKIAEETGTSRTGPVNVFHEIVHNDAVVRRLAADGVGSVDTLDEAPGGTIIISAHGTVPSVFTQARKMGLEVVDATCPLVIHIHKTINKLIAEGYTIIHYGDRDHVETIGVVGQAPADRMHVIRTVEDIEGLALPDGKYALTSQTTAGVDDFERISAAVKRRLSAVKIYNTVCNATSQRQAAVLDIAPEVQVMLVVGSSSSANSKRLREISEAACGRAFLINTADQLEDAWLDGVTTVGITAGASTPDFLVETVITKLSDFSSGKAEIIRLRDKDDTSCSCNGTTTTSSG